MELNEILKQLSKYKEGLTEQRWKMDCYILNNDYINVVRIDTSNKAGGKGVKQGKQWSIIFERTTNLKLEELAKFKKLAQKSGYIRITPRVNYLNQYGIRIYNMAKNPDMLIMNELFDYLFN
jgi:hypothetical protein